MKDGRKTKKQLINELVEMRQRVAELERSETKRKRAEDAIRESEERYRAVVDNIGIGVSVIGPNMEILSLNNQMKKWFPDIDVSKKPICYRSFNNPPREGICPYCPTYKTLKDGQVHESITDTPAGDKIRNYRIISSPIKDKAGKILAGIEMVEDITGRKRVQEALQESEWKYRNLFENANDAIFIFDIKTRTILDANRQAEQLTGCSKEEIIGVRESKLHPPKHAEYYKDIFRKHVQMGQIVDLEGEVIKKDGSIVPVFISAGGISLRGKQVIQAIFRDITKEKKILDLKEQIEARKLIGKAKGILMDRYKISEKEAIRRLQKESRRQNKKIKEIARAVISSELILN